MLASGESPPKTWEASPPGYIALVTKVKPLMNRPVLYPRARIPSPSEKFIRGPLFIRFNPHPPAGEGRVRGLFFGFPVRFKMREFRQVDFERSPSDDQNSAR